MPLLDRAVRYAQETMTDTGVVIPEPDLVRLLEKQEAWLADFAQGHDTTTREWLYEIIAHELVGRDWPIGQTPKDEQARFAADFRREAAKRGWVAPLFGFPEPSYADGPRLRGSALAERASGLA